MITDFLRNKENWSCWQKIIGKSINISSIFNLNASIETSTTRTNDKFQAQGKSYSHPLSIQARYEKYQKELSELMKELQKEKNIKDINTDQNIEKTYELLKKEILQFQIKVSP